MNWNITAAIDAVVQQIKQGQTVRVKMQFKNEVIMSAKQDGLEVEITMEDDQYAHLRKVITTTGEQ